ncbi:MAG TPA: penicillin-binding protein [Bacteroidetes bacterium]|nr:penicillin-binding protein [Bacteroidota bacterium]
MKTKFFYSLIIAATALLAVLYLAFYSISASLPHIPDDFRQLVYSRPTQVFADDGSLVYQLRGQMYVPSSQISPWFFKGIIATEDARFASHHGIDKIGIARALYATLFRGRREGGSTITQQLAKVLFFSYRREVMRKFKDALVAVQLESMFSKEEILEAYANVVFFGGVSYGIEDAAQQYFSKHAADLTLSEAALLAGMVNSPNIFNPFTNFPAAEKRRRLVLRRMLATGSIDSSLYFSALADSIRLVPRRQRSNDFVDYVLKEAAKLFGQDAVQYGGLKIYTTLDPDLQKLAERTIADGVQKLEAELDSTGAPLQGAMAVVSVATGDIKALVGGRKRVPGGFNRAASSNRHVGSGIKPFLYYAAIDELGMTPASVVMDTMSTFYQPGSRPWRPRNFDRRYRGQLVLKSALMQSVNVIAAQIGARLTPKGIVRAVRRFGITAELPEILSLSIGTAGISPIEMASAYAVFARNGTWFEPTTIKRVEDVNGVVLFRSLRTFGDRRLQPQASYMTLDMMRGVVEEGGATSRAIRSAGFAGIAAGKTGTSTDFTDAWFNGYTSSLSVSVWVGYDRSYKMYRKNGAGVTGGYGAAPIWARFMRQASLRYPAREFRRPPGLKTVYVDPVFGWQVLEPADGLRVVVPEDWLPDAEWQHGIPGMQSPADSLVQ